jgi:hypothetical protein
MQPIRACFVPAEAIGATATEQPLEIKQNAKLLGKLEAIRRAASVAMGIAPLERPGPLSVRGVRGCTDCHARAVGQPAPCC